MWKKVKNNNDEKKQSNNQYICKAKLIEAIRNVTNGQYDYISKKDTECKEIADLWNVMMDSLREEKRESVMKINDLLKFITEMEFIKGMINDVRNQTNTFHSIAASSEEMSTSIDDVANFVQNVVDITNHTQQVATEGEENINNAFSFVNQSFEDIYSINNQIQSIIGKADKINEIVDIVKGIADQTNLLALNAAIEAARAGDAGRGFTVVADEVRNLAENTKESVNDIQKNINELKVDIEKSGARANETSSKLGSGKELVDNALNSMNTIIGKIRNVNDSIMQISANVEEQTATTLEITREIADLSGLTDNLLDECDRTGRAIFDLSKIVNDIRINCINHGLCLEDKELLEICIVDHLIWKWRIYNMILGYEMVDINNIGTHKDCRLGKWYYSEESKAYKSNRNFIAIEKDHIKLHQLAKEAAVSYNKNDLQRAQIALEEMGMCSEQVIKGLRSLKKK